MFNPTQNILSATSSCHLSLSAVMLAASVKVRLMVAMFFLTISIQCHKGGHPPGLFMSDTLRASIMACAAGKFGVAQTTIWVCLVVHSSLLYTRTCTLMTKALKSLSFRPVGIILCLKTTVRMMWSAAFA